MATTTTSEKRREFTGPAILGYGFRPFFLLAGIWAAGSMILWIVALSGRITLPTHLPMIDWHVHALLFGFVPAVMAGFLMTAIPNWTGRLPVMGTPLAVLALVWILGRLVMLVSAETGPAVAAAIDIAFLGALSFVAAREVIAGRNWRNLKVLIPVSVLLIANIVFHVEALHGSAAFGLGTRLGLSATLFLIMLIGGRIIPSFTRNWLVQHNPGRLPTPFGLFDGVTLGVSLVALIAWIVFPFSIAAGAACACAALFQTVRLARWAGDRTLAEPLLLILHVAYAFVPIGFALTAAAAVAPATVAVTTAVHAWTAGAVGLMTLSMMIRATRGHTGQALTAPPATCLILGLILASASLRILAPYLPAGYLLSIQIAGTAWILGFGGFVLAYAPSLCRRQA